MSADLLVNRYRTFLLLVAGFSCVFTVVELWLEEHTGSPTQLIPFILCGLGVAAIAAALVRPQRITVTLLRTVMGATLVGSLFGLYEHIEHNWEFAKEIRPNATFSVLLMDTLHGAIHCLHPAFWPWQRSWPLPLPTFTLHCKHKTPQADRFFIIEAGQSVASFRARPAPGIANFTPALVLKWDVHGLPTTLSTTPLSFQPG